jgi:hypothetical protein
MSGLPRTCRRGVSNDSGFASRWKETPSSRFFSSLGRYETACIWTFKVSGSLVSILLRGGHKLGHPSLFPRGIFYQMIILQMIILQMVILQMIILTCVFVYRN